MLRKLLTFGTSICLCLGIFTAPVHAEEEKDYTSTNSITTIKTEEEIKADLDLQVMEDYPEYAGLIKARATETITNKLGNPETRYANLGDAGGQPANGYIFNTGGYIYWADGGYNVNVNINFSWGLVGLSVSAGKASSSVTGLGAYCPPNVRCKLNIGKDITVQRYEYWLRDTSTGNTQYLGVYNTITAQTVHLNIYEG